MLPRVSWRVPTTAAPDDSYAGTGGSTRRGARSRPADRRGSVGRQGGHDQTAVVTAETERVREHRGWFPGAWRPGHDVELDVWVGILVARRGGDEAPLD